MLFSLLAAFDAIPEAWIEGYQLQVVMRNSDEAIPAMVASSYHFDHVRLISEDISSLDFEKLCSTSSALIVADPGLDSRAFSTAVNCGMATVVLAKSLLPEAGRGYVGGLMAELGKPASIYVALTHALRLAELRFPTPNPGLSWPSFWIVPANANPPGQVSWSRRTRLNERFRSHLCVHHGPLGRHRGCRAVLRRSDG